MKEIRKVASRSYVTISSVADVNRLMDQVRTTALGVHDWLLAQRSEPLDILRRMKFEAVGFHPVDGHPLNLIEQINQTWTYTAALAAVRQLLVLHPDVGGFRMAPGAHACLELDIMSELPGMVGAETFAAVTPRNNGKLAADLVKLAGRSEQHRYVFFMCPLFPGNKRLPQFENRGVEVWSVDI